MRRRGTSPVRVAGAIVWANVRRLLRDPTSLVFLLVVPFLLILILGVTLAGDEGGRPVGIVGGEEGPGTAARVAEALAAEPSLDLARYVDEEALRGAIRRGVVIAGVVLPADLDARVRAGETVEVSFLTEPGAAPPTPVRTAVAQVLTGEAASLRSARMAAERTGVSVTAALAAIETLPAFGGIEVTSETLGAGGEALPAGFDFTAPAYLVLFVFINTVVAAYGIPADRARGVTGRTLAAPTGAAAVLVGEGTYRLLLAITQAAVIVVVGGLFFGVAWGSPAAVAGIVLLFALVSTGASMLLGALARTPDQVTALAPPLGIALGMLGGCMWPLEIVGPTMRAIGRATPHAPAVSALQEVVGRGAGLADVATQLAVLGVWAVALVGLALVVFGRSLGRGGTG